MEKFIIFTDIDGTLFDHKTSSVPNSAIQAIKKAKENGHKVILSTGRTYADLESHYFDLDCDGYVLGCGGHIIYNHETICTRPMKKEIVLELVDFMKKHDVGFALEGIDKIYLFGYAVDMYRIWLSRYDDTMNMSLEDFYQLLSKRPAYPLESIQEEDYSKILKISFFTKNKEIMENFIQGLDSSLFGYFDNMSKVFYTGELYMREVNKASGMDILLDYINHPLSHTIALGDSLNDLEMIKHASIGVAMGNAQEELKKHADFITKNIDEDGFEYALKHFNLIGE